VKRLMAITVAGLLIALVLTQPGEAAPAVLFAKAGGPKSNRTLVGTFRFRRPVQLYDYVVTMSMNGPDTPVPGYGWSCYLSLDVDRVNDPGPHRFSFAYYNDPPPNLFETDPFPYPLLRGRYRVFVQTTCTSWVFSIHRSQT
jgi:hypothetical protein